jgi:hypothetical protein
MKKLLIAVAALAATLPAFAQNVGVSVNIGEPGFYGRIDIGNYPPPQVVYAQPVLVAPPPVQVVRPQPIYLRVPPGHQKNWAKHCAAYGACGQPVYFVQENWYQNVYAPQYRERYEHENHGHGHDRDDDDGHGHGHGHGRGHNKHDD